MIESVLDRLEGVMRNGSGYVAKCPAHSDENPSLAITERDGKILIHCHAGCEYEAVIAAAGIQPKDLFSQNGNSVQGKPLGPILATYDYVDENGVTLYQVVRYAPKTFRARRPDGTGGWTPNINGARRVLYHLPQIIAAEQVFVLEGEKDCSTAEDIGLVATTNVFGANAAWTSDYAEVLRGKHVVIVADADGAGRKHAREVAMFLHLIASSIKVIEMPAGSKDLTAFIESTNGTCTVDDLQRLVVAMADDAPVWSPDAPAPEEDWRGVFHSPADFLTVKPLSFSIEGFLQNDAATMIGGLSGHSKTFMMLAIAKALLAGEGTTLWNCFPVRETAERIIYLIPESALSPFVHRLRLMGLLDYTQDEKLLVRTLNMGPAPSLKDSKLLCAVKGAHIFLDTASRFSDGDENSASDNARGLASDMFGLLGAGARAVIGAHHSPKSFARDNQMNLENVLRGSGDLGAMLATCWAVKQIDAKQNLVHVENVKPRDFQPCGPFQIIGRPFIDEIGDFKLFKAPGICGTLEDEQPNRDRGGAPESQERQDRIGTVREWLADDPTLTVSDLVKKFKDQGITLSDRSVKRYKNSTRGGN